jgi:hypothetical protein
LIFRTETWPSQKARSPPPRSFLRTEREKTRLNTYASNTGKFFRFRPPSPLAATQSHCYRPPRVPA